MDLGMAIGEAQSSCAVVVGRRNVSPMPGAVDGWVVDEIAIIYGIRMLIEEDEVISRSGHLGELEPLAPGGIKMILAFPCRIGGPWVEVIVSVEAKVGVHREASNPARPAQSLLW